MTDTLQINKGRKRALLLGATGLVGRFCLDYLLAHGAYERVVALTRRPLDIQNDRLENIIVDFDRLGDFRKHFVADDVFCCLGTTMAKAGSREKFIRVDYTYVIESVRLALENGANQLLVVSSVGADASSVFFYSRIKGEMEAAVRGLKFWSTHIFRPSILLGDRPENRFGEQLAARLGKGIDFLTGGLLMKYRPVEAEIVAKAMVNAAQKLEAGIFVYPSHWLQKMAVKEDAIRQSKRSNV